jgi:hypothetical protein
LHRKKNESRFPTNKIINDKIEKRIILKTKKKLTWVYPSQKIGEILEKKTFKGTRHKLFLSSNLSENQTKIIT